MLAHDLLRCGTATVAIAGGMESMTNSPYLLPKARQGLRMGHGTAAGHGRIVCPASQTVHVRQLDGLVSYSTNWTAGC
jgi:acetyl-CoA acetyltransferase